MDRAIAIHHHTISGSRWIRHRQRLVQFSLGVIIAILTLAIVETTPKVVRAILADETAAATQLEPVSGPALSREWKGERQAITFDHMYPKTGPLAGTGSGWKWNPSHSFHRPGSE